MNSVSSLNATFLREVVKLSPQIFKNGMFVIVVHFSGLKFSNYSISILFKSTIKVAGIVEHF